MQPGLTATAALLVFAVLAAGQQRHISQFPPLDGSGHSTVDATWGSRGAWFQPQAAPNYADGISSMVLPHHNARNISNIIFDAPPFRYNSHGISAVAAAWGQFVAHDLVRTGPSPTGINATAGDALVIPVPTGDPDMDEAGTGAQTLAFRRNAWDLSTGTSSANPRVQTNAQTGWLDASTVYGVSDARAAELRAFYGGFLMADSTNGVPFNRRCADMASGPPPRTACDQRLAGDPRANVSPGLLTLHGLFVLEHNYWARKLAQSNPGWDDEVLFQEARKRVIAVIQSITVRQYLPPLMGEALPPYRGYNASVDPRISGPFAVAAYRYGHSGIDSSYWCIKADGSQCPTGNLLLREVYFDPRYLEWGVTIADLLRGMYVQLESAIDTAMVPDVRNRVEGFKKDLAAVDILRGRDFGVPSFAAARRAAGLPVPTSFADITTNPVVAAALAAAYQGDVSAVDLWVGGLAESAASGKFIGPTFRAIIKDQFARLRDGDWYWYENTANTVTGADGTVKRYLTDAEIAEISSTTLGKVIARHTDWTDAPANLFLTSGKFSFTVSANGAVTGGSNTGSGSGPSAAQAPASTTTADPGVTSTVTVARVTVNDLVTLQWTPPAATATSLTLTLSFAGDGWVAIGFGAVGMLGSDIWMMRRTGTGATGGEVVDTKATSYVTPATDAQQDVTLVSCTRTNGRTAFVLQRALNTGDANDAAITNAAVPVIVAWDPSSTAYGYHGANRAQTSINFIAPPASALVTITIGANGTTNDTGLGAVVSAADQEDLRRAALLSTHGWHGVSMFLVWGILVPAGSIAIRFLKHRPSHQAFHKWTMLTAATITLPAAGGALAQSVQRPATLAHAQLGMTVAGVLLLQVVFGAMVRSWLTESKLPPWYWQYVKQVHRALGWMLLIGGLSNCALGADMLLKNGRWGVLAYAATLVLVILVLLGYDEYQGTKRGKPRVITLDGDQGRRMSMSQSKFSLSMTELRANVRAGSKWVIMQGYIYDIGSFIKHHPGGAYLLERCIGHDITQFFFGREAFDAVLRPYAHSERAHALLRTMCVAALKADVAVRSWADAPTLDDAECTDTWTVSRRTVIDSDPRRPVVKLELQHPSALPVPALDWQPASFGRHMVAKVSAAALKAMADRDAGAAGSKLARLLGGSKRSVSVTPSDGRRPITLAGEPRYGGGGGRTPAGTITGNVPAHVQAAMSTWYARSRRTHPGSGGETPLATSAASPMGFKSPYKTRGGGSHARSESPTHRHRGIDDTGPGCFDAPPSYGGGGPSAPETTRSTFDAALDGTGKPGSTIERPYSIVRGDNKPGLIMYIRRYPRGQMSPYMFNLREGDEVTLSGPKGLGLHLDQQHSGVIVGIYQGTCVVAAFDLLQYIYATAEERRRRVVTSEPTGPESTHAPTVPFQAVSTSLALSQTGGVGPRRGRSAMRGARDSAAAASRRRPGAGDGHASADDTDLQQMLFAMPEPVAYTRIAVNGRGAAGASSEVVSDDAATPTSQSTDSDGVATAVGVTASPGSAGAGSRRQAPPGTTAAGMPTSRYRTAWSADDTPLPGAAAAATGGYGSDTDQRGRDGSAPTFAVRTSHMGDGAALPAAGVMASPGRTSLPPIRVPGESRPSIEVLRTMTELDTDPISARGTALMPGTGSGGQRAVSAGEKPHLKLVLLVVAEHEGAVIELEWLRHMDTICEDFELHLNLKTVRDPYVLGDFPRVSSGRLTAKRLEQLLPPTDLLTVSVCGTPNFQREVSELYRSMGLPRSLLTVVS